MRTFNHRLPKWGFSTLTTIALLAGIAPVTTAQPGRYGGSSAYWQPDYVGTLQMQESGTLNYTAIADVELQLNHDIFPDRTMFTYEMRGEITLTSPVVLKYDDSTLTCTPISPVPVEISGSRMALYTNDEEIPHNSYEIRVYQTVRAPDCVNEVGEAVSSPFYSFEVNFDSSMMAIAARPAAAPVEVEPIAISAADQAVLEQQQQMADDMVNHPQFQQEMQRLQDEYQRTGRVLTEADMLAIIARLEQSGAIPDASEVPMVSPELQQQFDEQAAGHSIDYSHLLRFTDINHLQDQMTLTQSGQTSTFSWDLHRVNAPEEHGPNQMKWVDRRIPDK